MSKTIRKIGKLALSIVIAMVMTLGVIPAAQAAVGQSNGQYDDNSTVYAASAKVYQSGIYKVTVNYKNKKPKSVNIVGSKPFKEGIAIPAKLKVKIKGKTHNLPVVYLKKLSNKYLEQESGSPGIILNKAKYLKKIEPTIKYLLCYKTFIFCTRSSYDYPVVCEDLSPDEVFMQAFGGHPYNKETIVVVPKTIFGFKVVSFYSKNSRDSKRIKGYDISKAKHIRVLNNSSKDSTNFFCNGYILRSVNVGNDINYFPRDKREHSPVRIVGTYDKVADPEPTTIYGLYVVKRS
jgi:hypothetical protein